MWTRTNDIERAILEELRNPPATPWVESMGVSYAREIENTANLVIDTQVELIRRVNNTGLSGPELMELRKTILAAGIAGRAVIISIADRAVNEAQPWSPYRP